MISWRDMLNTGYSGIGNCTDNHARIPTNAI